MTLITNRKKVLVRVELILVSGFIFWVHIILFKYTEAFHPLPIKVVLKQESPHDICVFSLQRTKLVWLTSGGKIERKSERWLYIDIPFLNGFYVRLLQTSMSARVWWSVNSCVSTLRAPTAANVNTGTPPTSTVLPVTSVSYLPSPLTSNGIETSFNTAITSWLVHCRGAQRNGFSFQNWLLAQNLTE